MIVLWQNGFHGTSLDELVARSGASRASLYKTFGDKRSLMVRALDAYARRFETRVEALLKEGLGSTETMRALLTASVDRLTGGEAPPGCLRCNTTLEMGGTDPVIDAALDDVNARFVATMETVLALAVAEGRIRDDESRETALFLTGIVGGLVTMARSGHPRAELMAVVDRALRGIGMA